jgi:hypothetical protein
VTVGAQLDHGIAAGARPLLDLVHEHVAVPHEAREFDDASIAGDAA